MDLAYTLLLSIFVIAFALPCFRLIIYEPLYALIHAKEIVARKLAQQQAKKAEAARARAAAEAKRLALERTLALKAEMRQKERAQRQAHSLLQGLLKKSKHGKHEKRGDGRFYPTPWDPHGLKRKRAEQEGRLGRKLKTHRPEAGLEAIVQDPGAIARLVAEAKGVVPPLQHMSKPLSQAHQERERRRAAKKKRFAQGSSAFVFAAAHDRAQAAHGAMKPLPPIRKGKVVPV